MSWLAGFSVIAGSVGIAVLIFLIGIPRYQKQVPVGSPLTRVAQVIVAASKKWRLSTTRHHYGICYEEGTEEDKSESTNAHLLARTNQFRYLLNYFISIFDHLSFNNCLTSKVVQHVRFMGTSYAF